MRPVSFPQQNAVLNAPPSLDEVDCEPLPVAISDETPPAIFSQWELSDEDIEQLKRTKRIWLIVVGRAHPPVSLKVVEPQEMQSKEPS